MTNLDQFKSACVQCLTRGFEEFDLTSQDVINAWVDTCNDSLSTSIALDFDADFDLDDDE
jgi:hypothetical protein